MVSRRDFIKSSTVLGAAAVGAPALILPKKSWAQAATAVAAGPLDPATQPRWVNSLPNPLDQASLYIPTGMATVGGKTIPAYDLRIRQFLANPGLFRPNGRTPLGATTKVWGYGTALQAPTFPGRTFQFARGTRAQVAYNNQLGTARNPLPSFLPIDTTIEWANTGNNGATAPVPLVAHLHGGDSNYLSDGLPDAWETPGAALKGVKWSKPYIYDNVQEAGHLWYHDHALGVTRTNVYSGLAGNYFIRGVDELFLIGAKRLPAWPYEVPLVLQDRNFLADGSLFYPSDPSLYPDLTADQIAGLPNPTHLPEFFGDVMLVNGVAWPNLDVERRQYRLRLLNGSDSRVYSLKIEQGANSVPMYVIGTELGMLNNPALVADRLTIAPGERYDVVVDFTGKTGGFILTNTANSPFRGNKENVYGAGDPPGSTGEIMRFSVVKPLSSVPVTSISPTTNLRPISGPLPAMPAPVKTRKILLFEGSDPYGRLMTTLGPVDSIGGFAGTRNFKDPITETPALNSTEIWEFYNTTVDAHPIHMHLVDFRVLDRQDFTIAGGDPNANVGSVDRGGYTYGTIDDPTTIAKVGTPTPPPATEAGPKDTVATIPGTVTRVIATFKRRGPYVYHCHILSHEDHEMMRPYEVR
jgi:spore coat protein A